ncbi:MAG: hypothetical protein WKG00_30100 [Polyangiaceae bacterium]
MARITATRGSLAAFLVCAGCAPSAPLTAVAPGEAPVEATAVPEVDAPPPPLAVASRRGGGEDDAPLPAGTYAMDVPGYNPAVVVVPPTAADRARCWWPRTAPVTAASGTAASGPRW